MTEELHMHPKQRLTDHDCVSFLPTLPYLMQEKHQRYVYVLAIAHCAYQILFQWNTFTVPVECHFTVCQKRRDIERERERERNLLRLSLPFLYLRETSLGP